MNSERTKPLSSEVHRFENEGRTGKKIYQTEAGPVEVMWRKFEYDPKSERGGAAEKKSFAQATIFLPGSMMDANARSLEPLNQAFADRIKGPAYAVSTRAERPAQGDTFRFEAEAIRQFIEEHGLKDLIIVGYSLGGDKAIDVADALRNHGSRAEVRGLVLLDSVGLYEREPEELSSTSTKHTALDIPPAVLNSGERSQWKKFKQVLTDVLFNVIRETIRSKTGYSRRLQGEVESMAKLNPRIGNIDVPVILVHGAEDPISDPKKVASVDAPSEREAYLKEHLFTSSPSVKMVVAEKAGHHALPFLRSESVARASLYMLERFYRGKNKIQ